MIARALVIEGNELLVCRSTTGGYDYLPGGHVEPGESARQSLIRELEEEAGLEVVQARLLTMAEIIFMQEQVARHEFNLVFHVERSDKQPIESRESHISFHWVDLGSLPDVDLRPQALKAWIMSNQADMDTQINWISHVE